MEGTLLGFENWKIHTLINKYSMQMVLLQQKLTKQNLQTKCQAPAQKILIRNTN